jgi:hypothetical protein
VIPPSSATEVTASGGATTEGFVLRYKLSLNTNTEPGVENVVAVPTKTDAGAIGITVDGQGNVDKERIAMFRGTTVNWDFGSDKSSHAIVFDPTPAEHDGPFESIDKNHTQASILRGTATHTDYVKYNYKTKFEIGGGPAQTPLTLKPILHDPQIDYLPPPTDMPPGFQYRKDPMGRVTAGSAP